MNRARRSQGLRDKNSGIYESQGEDTSYRRAYTITSSVFSTFSLKSYDMNETKRRLTMAITILLPLTLLTGYFVRPLS